MELSIIITSYKNPQLLRLCIDSIKKNTKKAEYEIIVCDGETEEETEMMMREDYQDVKFFPFKENVGFQALLKKGIKNSTGKYLLLLNGDILVHLESVGKLLDFVKQNKQVGVAGPKLLNFNGTPQDSCFRFYKPMTILYRRTFLKKLPFAKRHLEWFLMTDKDKNKTMEVDWLMGSALMVRREHLNKVGFMDSRFFMYMEDVDWCRRFWEKGYSVVYYPESVMHHYHGKGSAKGGFLKSVLFNKLTWIHIISGFKYFFKYRGKENPRKLN